MSDDINKDRETIRCSGVFGDPSHPGVKKFCRRRTKNYSGFCRDHRYQVAANDMIIVIGSTIDNAHAYALSLRLDDYMAYGPGDINKLQGMRCRGIVVTPGYILQAEKKVGEDGETFDKSFVEFYVALQSFFHSGAPVG